MNSDTIKHIVEAALLAAGRPLAAKDLLGLFDPREAPGKKAIVDAVEALNADYQGRGIEVAEVASGYRMQVRREMTPHLERLWDERLPRYSRALLETLALIAYRQPITRGEIEDVRGVAVSTNIIRTLLDREWIREVGHKDVPGKPAMFGTTREFLDYFGLKSLDELPSLAELRDIDSLNVELPFGDAEVPSDTSGETAADNGVGTLVESNTPLDETAGADQPEETEVAQGASDAAGQEDAEEERAPVHAASADAG